MQTKSFYNKSLERALQILIGFSSAKTEMTLLEISEAVDVPKSTTFRLCSTLLDFGFLRFDTMEKKYSLGPRLFELGGIISMSLSINKVASAHLNRLHEISQQTIFLDILQDDQLVHVDKREHVIDPIRLGVQIGKNMPPHYGALGQVIMAHLPEDEVDHLLDKFPLVAYNKKSVSDISRFKKRLKTTRGRGYFVDKGEVIDIMTVVGAPIYNWVGKVEAAVGVAYVSKSVNKKDEKMIIDETVKAARNISSELGYTS